MIDPIAAQMGERLIRQCEGCVLHPYQDTAGNWTIGIGSIRLADGSPVTATTPPITSDQADALMLAELTSTIAEVDGMLPASATTHQRAALYSFAYNEGCGALAKSTLLRLFLAGDVAGAAAQFAAWVYAGGKISKGLQNRRALEKSVFLGLTTP